MPDPPVHLLDVNVVLALLDHDHIHNEVTEDWFSTPGLQWALCPFTEAGVIRFFTRPKTGDMSMEQIAAMLDSLKQKPVYTFSPSLATGAPLRAHSPNVFTGTVRLRTHTCSALPCSRT